MLSPEDFEFTSACWIFGNIVAAATSTGSIYIYQDMFYKYKIDPDAGD